MNPKDGLLYTAKEYGMSVDQLWSWLQTKQKRLWKDFLRTECKPDDVERAYSKILEERKMILGERKMPMWDKELYAKMRAEGKSNTEISRAMGFNSVAALKHCAERDGVYSTLEQRPKSAPLKDPDGGEMSRKQLVEELQAILEPTVSEATPEEGYPEIVVDSPAEEEAPPIIESRADEERYIVIRIPLQKLEPTTTSLVVVTDSIRHNLKRISSQLARVNDDITHLLGVEDATEHVQQYIDRQLKGII